MSRQHQPQTAPVFHALGNPTIGIHDRFDQQAKALELSEIEVFHSLIKAGINPVSIALLIDREVLIQRLTPDAVGESIVMHEVGGLQLQAHGVNPLRTVRLHAVLTFGRNHS